MLVDQDGQRESVSLDRVTLGPSLSSSETAIPMILTIIYPDEEVMDLTGPNAEMPAGGEEEPEEDPFRTRLVDQSQYLEQTEYGLHTGPPFPPCPDLRNSRSDDEETEHPGAPRRRRFFSRFKTLPPVEAVYDHIVAYELLRGCPVTW